MNPPDYRVLCYDHTSVPVGLPAAITEFASVMSLTIKAFLYKRWGKEPTEIRRFVVDQDVTTSYAYLTQKIAQVFPSLTADNVIVCWTGKQPRFAGDAVCGCNGGIH